jgi:hypothetical protein
MARRKKGSNLDYFDDIFSGQSSHETGGGAVIHELSAVDEANNIEFDVKFHGFDREQVTDYIDALTADYNAICKKCAALETENEGLRKALATLDRGWLHTNGQ